MPEPTDHALPGTQTPLAAERRAEPRERCAPWAVVRVVARPSLRPFTAYTRDVSAQGLGFLNDYPLEVGRVLALQLAAGPRGASGVRTARVVHVTPCDGLWLIGCTVSPPFSAAEREGLR